MYFLDERTREVIETWKRKRRVECESYAMDDPCDTNNHVPKKPADEEMERWQTRFSLTEMEEKERQRMIELQEKRKSIHPKLRQVQKKQDKLNDTLQIVQDFMDKSPNFTNLKNRMKAKELHQGLLRASESQEVFLRGMLENIKTVMDAQNRRDMERVKNNRCLLMKLLYFQAQTLPLWVSTTKQPFAPAGVGACAVEETQPLAAGDLCAAFYDETWILAQVVNVHNSGKYDLRDVDLKDKNTGNEPPPNILDSDRHMRKVRRRIGWDGTYYPPAKFSSADDMRRGMKETNDKDIKDGVPPRFDDTWLNLDVEKIWDVVKDIKFNPELIDANVDKAEIRSRCERWIPMPNKHKKMRKFWKTEEDEEPPKPKGTTFSVFRKRLIALPKYRADPARDPHALFPPEAVVLALYPQTTCFYKGVIIKTPRTAISDYFISFEDKVYPSGWSPPSRVPQRYVVTFKEIKTHKKKMNIFDERE